MSPREGDCPAPLCTCAPRPRRDRTVTEPVRAPKVLPRIAAVVLAAIVGGIVFGLWRALGFDVHYLIDLIAGVWLLWLHLDRANVHDKADAATDDADRADRRAEAIEHHLTGTEPPGHGRHAKSASPAPSTRRTPS